MMMVHQFNVNNLPDSDFENGSYEFLLKGNECRLKDSRRTPGILEDVYEDTGFFRWRITDFEDKGKFWDLPIETVFNFQFRRNLSLKIPEIQSSKYKTIANKFDRPLVIERDASASFNTENLLVEKVKEAENWLVAYSKFFQNKNQLNQKGGKGSTELMNDFRRYMESRDLWDLEEKTSEMYVLNPHSGEWFKGIEIVCAELGLADYVGKVIRTPDIWEGRGHKNLRCEYVLHRIAFLRAFFRLAEIECLTLYRGMATEGPWIPNRKKTFSSWSFDIKVAESFTRFHETQFKNVYLIKREVPIKQLFMTYLETEAMNRQYSEAEAIIFNDLDF